MCLVVYPKNHHFADQSADSGWKEQTVDYIPNLHSAGIYIGTRYGEFSRQEERLHYAVFFQLLMKSSPGDAEPSGSFALVAACRFEGLQDGYLFHFLQG